MIERGSALALHARHAERLERRMNRVEIVPAIWFADHGPRRLRPARGYGAGVLRAALTLYLLLQVAWLKTQWLRLARCS
jgi:hypothetical protein